MNSFFNNHSTIRFIPTLAAAFFASAVFLPSAIAADPTPPPNIIHQGIIHHFKGTITAVNATSLTVTKKKTNESRTFQLSSETTVSKSDHSQGIISELSVGQRVQVKLSPDGQKALHIYIRKQQNQEMKPSFSPTAANIKKCNAPCLQTN